MQSKALEVWETPEGYTGMIDELNALKTEENFDLSTRQLQWAHLWGKTIREYCTGDEKLERLLTRVSVDVGRSKRVLYRYVALYDRYPMLEKGLNEHGKNVSMRKLLGEAQTEPVEPKQRDGCKHCVLHCD